MINEFGDEISEEEIEEIVEVVRNLDKKSIDELWYLCGVIDKNRGDNSALPDWEIDKIKEKPRVANGLVRDLLMNVPYKEFVGFLAKLEKN